MTDALVKLTIDLYAPDATLSTRERDWLMSWDKFPTRRVVFPVEPIEKLTKITDPITLERTVTQDFCHLRLTTMDAQYEGLLDSELDHILTNVRLDRFFGEHLFLISQDALMRTPPFRQFRAHVAWCEVWTFDDESLLFRKEVSLYRLMNLALERSG